MTNFGISQNFRPAAINRKQSRAMPSNAPANVSKNIFESGDNSFVKSLDSKKVETPAKADPIVPVPSVRNINMSLQTMKSNKAVFKTADHH